MDNSNLGLKHFTIKNYNITSLPVISQLESLKIDDTKIISARGLNILAYSNLRCLYLSSLGIDDVSSLDGVHELLLQYCDSIHDISCLNHNYKIVIDECNGIKDYSNSFRYSKIIDISCPSNCCDLSKGMEGEIFFFGGDCPQSLIIPQSLSLRIFEVENVEGSFILPYEHHIRGITLRECSDFTSLLNFDLIYSVKLFNLNILTLEGLGRGNRVVEVDSCEFIADFSMLRNCDKVTILNCPGFQDVDQVRGVKDFIFSPVDIDNLPENMEGVTCLIIDYEETFNLLSLKFPTTLKKVVFTSPSLELIEQLPLFLASLPHNVRKVEVSEDEFNVNPCLDKPKSFPNFVMEFNKGFHFLRKHS